MGTLEWQDVSIDYKVHRSADAEVINAVKNVSLTLPQGGTIGIAGESGSGKSTLAMSALRLLPPSARIHGRIMLDGEDLTEMTFGRLRAVRWTGAAIVFQGAMSSLNPVHRIRKQLLEAMELHSNDRWRTDKARNARVDELMGLVDLPVSKAESYPHELSGGQKQRVMIAMAMACDPDIIVADEPTTALDVVVQAQVLEVLSHLVRERGLSLLMISHDLSVLAATCDELVVMQNGEIVERGPSAEVMHDGQHPHTRELAAAFPTIGDPSSRLRVGRAGISSSEANKEHEPGAARLEVRDLSVHFHSRGETVKAVDNVSLSCRQGEIVALVGQSGSGKTTLARTLLGLQKPTSGAVLFDGEPLSQKYRDLKAYRRKVQFVPQDPAASLNPKRTVYESIAEGISIHKLGGDEYQRVAEALTRAELTPPERFMGALPQEISGGQRQRVIIAGALALEPEYLIADEPVASLDASVRGEILALLLSLKNDLGLGALVITHDLGLAWNIADRVLVMHRGKIVEQGRVEDVLLNPQHEYTRTLLSVVPSVDGIDLSALSQEDIDEADDVPAEPTQPTSHEAVT